MRRRGRWGCPAPGGGAGLREVDGRYLRGTPQVERGHVPCWQVAARMAWHVMRYASCPRCPRAASLFAGIGPASGSWQDRADRSGHACRDPVRVSFLRSLVVIWRARTPGPRCGEVVISLIRPAGVVALRAVSGGLTLWP